MKRRMNQQVVSKGIQLVTISRPTAILNKIPINKFIKAVVT